MSGHRWSLTERILLTAAVVIAIMAVVRLVAKPPPPAPAMVAPVQQEMPDLSEHAATANPAPDAVAGPPPSPAAAELLARIRSCSEKDLEAVVDKMSGLEAAGLYRQLTPTDRQQVFSALPAPILAKKAQALLGVPEGYFRHARRPGLLASSLVDAAMDAGGGPAGARVKTLGFAASVDAQGAPQDLRGIFRPDERTIYACLDAGVKPLGEPGVLVRWTAEDSGALVYLHYLPLALNSRWNHVYFKVKDAWTPGSYRVRLYRLGETASLLAEGTYVIGRGD